MAVNVPGRSGGRHEAMGPPETFEQARYAGLRWNTPLWPAQFVAHGAETWTRPADRALSIGSAHAWGDTAQAVTALAALVPAGGHLLYGDGYWERPPGKQAIELFGDGVLVLEQAVAAARAQGWHVLHLSTAEQREWDEFESGWRAGRDRWLTAHPEDPQAEKLAAELDARTDEYVNVYRGVIGFCYLVLGR